jgi:hypothetical protein
MEIKNYCCINCRGLVSHEIRGQLQGTEKKKFVAYFMLLFLSAYAWREGENPEIAQVGAGTGTSQMQVTLQLTCSILHTVHTCL